MANFWDNEEFIGKVAKNSKEEIHIKRVEKNGKKYIDIRTFWLDTGTNEFKPSQKGLAVSYDSFDEFKTIINSI